MAKSSSAPRLADRGLAPLAPPARAMAPRLLRLREGCRVSRAAGRGKKKRRIALLPSASPSDEMWNATTGAQEEGGPPGAVTSNHLAGTCRPRDSTCSQRPQSRLGNRPRSAQERHLETVTGEHDELSLEPHALDTLASTTRNTLHDPDAELRLLARQGMTSVQTSGPRTLDPELNKALASKSGDPWEERANRTPLSSGEMQT
ncbi:hypothetical protein JHW43_006261 [Diplocarpon mali]|nr:hypothetical protein JHW43_006261 [Diplocarpon mali]